MDSKVTFKKAELTDAALLAATRQKAWAATYRGIFPDEMIDQYDLELYAAKDREKLQDPKRETYLLLDGEACVGYFSYGSNARGSDLSVHASEKTGFRSGGSSEAGIWDGLAVPGRPFCVGLWVRKRESAVCLRIPGRGKIGGH